MDDTLSVLLSVVHFILCTFIILEESGLFGFLL
jgi:hypothetical protein